MNDSHRPWPVPKKPWIMKQTWNHLLFAHWKIDKDLLRPFIPMSLEVDTFNGEAWIAVVPFEMSNIQLRYLPKLPFISEFPEINVRTYVTKNGKPGVYFFSLDAANYLAVHVAKKFFYLPYYYATFSVLKDGETLNYHSNRYSTEKDFTFEGTYSPISEVFFADQGTLEHWLTERYCLYTTHKNRLFMEEIHHDPWPLQYAEAKIKSNTMLPTTFNQTVQNTRPLLHYSHQIDVLVWGLKEIK